MSDKILEIKNFIPLSYQDELDRVVHQNNFPWFFMEDVTHHNKAILNQIEEKNAGFFHQVYKDDEIKSDNLFQFVLPIYYLIQEKTPINIKELYRLRLGNIVRSVTDNHYHNPHIDYFTDHWTALYYVNDSDGDTFIFNETNPKFSEEYDKELKKEKSWSIKKKISPQKGKLVLFNGKHYHASSSPKINSHRIVLTINFKGTWNKFDFI